MAASTAQRFLAPADVLQQMPQRLVAALHVADRKSSHQWTMLGTASANGGIGTRNKPAAHWNS